MSASVARIPTGSAALDAALGGGFHPGCLVLVCGEPGAGAAELAFTLLRGRAMAGVGARARLASLWRSPLRIERELASLFPGEKHGIETLGMRDAHAWRFALEAAGGLGAGDALVVEGLSSPSGGAALAPLSLLESLAEAAAAAGEGLVLVLHAEGSLAPEAEANARALADYVLDLRWARSATALRRTLALPRAMGLPVGSAGGEIPVFEVSLEAGIGFDVSRVTRIL